jgi:uncharacterized protein with HEPN domain
MLSEQRDAAYLLDILQSAEKVKRYAAGKTLEMFLEDDLLRDAIERNLEIIGEACRRISDQFKQEHAEIPWRQIIAQRNVLIHEYNNIQGEEIWDVVTFHIPKLILNIRSLIPPLPPEVE